MNFQIYNINGLPFWNEESIFLRRHFESYLAMEIKSKLLEMNPAWAFYQIEAPILTPKDIINQNYTNTDVWVQENVNESSDLVLRPETTPGSYKYAQHLLNHQLTKPPFCVWQSGKSFRREQDQVVKNMRLKEFYQQEFQCIYTAETLNDYQSAILQPLEALFAKMLHLPTRIVESDRLPSYSLKTMDVEVDNGDKWMEICSISKRTDFPQKATFQSKKGNVEKDLLVLEIAIGLDRLVFNALKDRKKVGNDIL